MPALLLKYRKPCGFALCILLGLACGDLAATALGLRLNRSSLPAANIAAAARAAPAANPARDLAFILQHNLFDPASRSSATPALSLQSPAEMTTGATAQGSLELVGTVVAGESSLAVLRSGQVVKAYRLGVTLPGGGKVDEVTRFQAKIRNADRSVTVLTMHEGNRPAPPASSAQGGSPVGNGDIRMVGDNRWAVPRATAEAARGNLGEQLRLAQMQPRVIDGRTDGFIVRSITPGSLLSQLGLRRGDVIKRVNATPIDSPERALQILQQLREAREISVDLERDGKPLNFAYAIE